MADELKKLAKEMVWVQDGLEKENLNEFEREEYKELAEEIRKKLLKNGYSVDLFVQYMEEYRNVLLGEYQQWINS
ncbi:hypothetical protein [Bacillus thuringiensis]|uniref:hypothetical protein n=1 Tax=Bacillus thuringiensis TaxID=1428 RepID=UPI0021002A4B|nr:hypothetical protein [Bacillus thuringiensis]